LKLETQVKLAPDVCHGCKVSLLVEAGETAHGVAVEDSDIPADFSLVGSDASHSEMSMEIRKRHVGVVKVQTVSPNCVFVSLVTVLLLG
jgi:hypothetical protein